MLWRRGGCAGGAVEGRQEIARALRPLGGRLRETARDQVGDGLRHIRSQLRDRTRDGRDVRGDQQVRALLLKRRVAGEQLVAKAAKGVEVRAVVDCASPVACSGAM